MNIEKKYQKYKSKYLSLKGASHKHHSCKCPVCEDLSSEIEQLKKKSELHTSVLKTILKNQMDLLGNVVPGLQSVLKEETLSIEKLISDVQEHKKTLKRIKQSL